MLDLNSDINSLSNFKRNTPEFLRQLKETGHPVVLTINGKAELVVQDAASYQKLIEIAEPPNGWKPSRHPSPTCGPASSGRSRTCWPRCGKSLPRSKVGELPRRCDGQGCGGRGRDVPLDRRAVAGRCRPLVRGLGSGDRYAGRYARTLSGGRRIRAARNHPPAVALRPPPRRLPHPFFHRE